MVRTNNASSPTECLEEAIFPAMTIQLRSSMEGTPFPSLIERTTPNRPCQVSTELIRPEILVEIEGIVAKAQGDRL